MSPASATEFELKAALKKLDKLKDVLPKGTRKRMLRQSAKIAVNIARQNAPVSPKPHYRYSTPKASSKFKAPKGLGKIEAIYNPGNLRDSIDALSFRRSQDVFVGPRTGRRSKNGKDGYYAHMVEFGTQYTPPNPFMRRTAAQAAQPVLRDLTKRIEKRVKKEADKLAVT